MAAHRRRHEVTGMMAAPPGTAVCRSVAMLLLRWQETGSDESLESLVGIALPEVRRVIDQTLRQRGIKDPAAVDDALSLVFDHLRRLPGAGGEREVARFAPARASPGSRRERDPGIGYLRQLARARACDVARARRRLQIAPFSALGLDVGRSLERSLAGLGNGQASPPPSALLAEAARALEPRQRTVVELLLEGKSQAVIAHVLGVNEGTVSRLRARAIDALRRLLDH